MQPQDLFRIKTDFWSRGFLEEFLDVLADRGVEPHLRHIFFCLSLRLEKAYHCRPLIGPQNADFSDWPKVVSLKERRKRNKGKKSEIEKHSSKKQEGEKL